MAVNADFPDWVMLERFVFRRDEEPDGTIPIWARGTTSWGLRFRVGLCLAGPPPLISRFYAQLRGYPDDSIAVPLVIMGTHRHLLLLRVSVMTPGSSLVQDFFVFSAHDPSSLKALPPCTEAALEHLRLNGHPKRRPPAPRGAPDERRLMTVGSMGLFCQNEHEFAVAELTLFKHSSYKVEADICFLRTTSAEAASADDATRKWASIRQRILNVDGPDDAWQLCLWETHTVIPVDHFLCWIDYNRGILFLDVFKEPVPTVSFLRLPLDSFPSSAISSSRARSGLYRCVSTINAGRELMFVNVTRHDAIPYGPLKPGAGFTITCHTLDVATMLWNKKYMLTSDELWSANPAHSLPHDILMLPQVNIERPHVLYFLMSDYKYLMRKMWLVTLDMQTKTVESVSQYINGREDLQTKDADFTEAKSASPMAFLPCEFSKWLRSSRKRKESCLPTSSHL